MGKSVLIADDNVVMRNLVKFYLKSFKTLEIQEVVDGIKALTLCKIETIDIMFLDLSMPGIDGNNVAKYINDNKEIKTEIIVVSATLDRTIQKRLKSLGVKYFLPKPIDKSRMDEIMNEILAKDFSNN